MNTKKQDVVDLMGKELQIRVSHMGHLEDVLSDMFRNELNLAGDPQIAFDLINQKSNGLLSQYFVYTLSEEGESWYVSTGDEYNESKREEYAAAFKSHYHEEFHTLDDMTSKLEQRVRKDMDNVGCGAKTALSMILEEDLLLENVFSIAGADAEPRIEYYAS